MTGHAKRPTWRFAIDVGGTFTDCVGVSPSGEVRVFKTLSSGQTKGVVARVSDRRTMEDPARGLDPDGFWNGASLRFNGLAESFLVESHDAARGTLTLATPLPDDLVPGTAYELSTGEEAPVLGIRYLLGHGAGEALPPCEVRLGTTRGTNALLERRGARVGFVTTRGFGDLLLIGDQARPQLFELAVRKPVPLTHCVIEVDERLAADGSVLVPLDIEPARAQLRELQAAGVESLAISLLHAYRNPVHERALGELAREVGFREVVLSHAVSPSIKIVPRAESTVLDAYLNPVLRQYVQRIESGLTKCRMGNPARPRVTTDSVEALDVNAAQWGSIRNQSSRPSAGGDGQDCPSYDDGSLLLMTSSGGLLTADRFSGKESVLSGPAGGAIGFSTTATRAGHPRSIGFDMGGTSTDVSRFDGRFELETESRKAGIRIASPTLAIETVAAGGGSLCGFDGVKLTVGPASAGAEPGPACYGRGGPLTITDCNLFLGRIMAGRFPFPLDGQAAESRLAELSERVRTEAGYTLTIEQLAEGLLAIANSHMARAVRRISVARGYDPQEYALAVFGGAGAQHACALAQELGVRTIVVHPLASVLSAYGIACASETRHASRTLLVPLASMSDDQLRTQFEELFHEASARRESAESATSIQRVERSLDLRYVGIEATITITEPSRMGNPARPRDAEDSRTCETTLSEADLSRALSEGSQSGGLSSGDGQDCPSYIHDFIAAYEAAHQREFGFRREGRPVEVVAARVLVTHEQRTPPEVPARLSWQLVAGKPQRVRVAGRWVEVTPWERSRRMGNPARPRAVTDSVTALDVNNPPLVSTEPASSCPLACGDGQDCPSDIDGPALVCESMTTLFVDEGWQAKIAEEGSITVSRRMGNPARPRREVDSRTSQTDLSDRETRSITVGDGQDCPSDISAPDPIQLEIFNNLFASIAEQMGETLRRTSVSTNVKERLDYSCALFDGTGELIVNAPHIPVHLGAMSETVKRVLADNPDLQPGDVVLTNDPYRGGSHLPDLTVVTPVFGAAGTILFIVASRAHHAELGGIVPGSMPPFSKTLADEGVLIRNLRIVRQGAFQEAALRELLTAGPYPSRRPDDNVADVTAQIAANQTGVHLLDQLVERHSLPTVQQYMQFIREAAAVKVRRVLAALPDGEYRCVDHLDDGSPIAATITIEGDSARVSFVGTGPVLASNLNANRAIVTSAVLYVFRTLIDEEIPLNGGVLIPVTIELPECLLNPPAHDDPEKCAAIVGGNVETSQRVVDVLLGALKLAAASQGTMNNLTFGDATFGYYETICGGSGATRTADGADAVQVHMTNTRLTDVELLEHRYPVRVRRFAIRRGSGGRGQQHGGAGIIREIEFLRPMTASILSQRRGPYPPPGMDGGEPGQLGRNTLIRADGETTDLGAAAQVSLQPGDRLTIETPGGGGWGQVVSEP